MPLDHQLSAKIGIRTAIIGLFMAAWFASHSIFLTANETATEVVNRDGPGERSPSIGTKIGSFALSDFRGREFRSEEFASAPAIALVFLGTECPLAKMYALRINQLEEAYKDSGVAFLAINPNVQDSLEMMASFARRHHLEMPFLKDPAQELANAVGATRTPEVCLLDSQRKLVYRGRIDDQFGIGYVREAPQGAELKEAIDSVLGGKPVAKAEVPAAGCLIGRRKDASSGGEVTYANQIARLVQNNCLECHRDGEIGPMSFTHYEDVAAWSDMMMEVIDQRRMPPWHASAEYGHFSNDRKLSEDEIALFRKWVDDGAPLGDVSQLPEPKNFTLGWQLPREPDLIIPVSPKPVKVPAKGVVDYKHFTHKLKFDEDKWIQAAEIRPGNRAVVHHVLVFDRPAGSREDIMPHRSFFAGFVPGAPVPPLPEGMAKRLPAGSELVFQVHYTPIGTEVMDQSQLGLIFVDDPSKLTHEIQTTSVVDFLLQIPPGDASYPSTADLQRPLPECELLSLSPHMHLRGKSFKFTAIFPDGRRDTLLDVPDYDFNWQTDYRLSSRLPIPAGTQIVGEATFDNSEENLNNPNSTEWVSFGEQTWDEMMIGYLHVAIPIDPSTGRAKTSVLPKDNPENGPSPKEIFTRFDRDGDGKLRKEEIHPKMKPFFILLDKDRDGFLVIEEFKLPDFEGRRGRRGLN